MIVFDFCGVLGDHPSDAARALVQRRAGRSDEGFWADYWAHRLRYDTGELSDEQYWSRVAPEAADLRALVEADVTSWLTLRPGMIALVDELPGPKAILSNAPTPLARRVDTAPWAERFAHRVFSADIGVVKPDPCAYRGLCATVGMDPADLLFIDDRPENVHAARAAGLRSLLFTDIAALRTAFQ